ncbi:hypothetical protein WJX81_000068 [Elliptochloris bilobata]|uniref:Uncharacterized protein n=1 Tax=Elliptochloris bilobata TaxID=381761 RepID=A0AAW1RF74_9CHLO
MSPREFALSTDAPAQPDGARRASHARIATAATTGAVTALWSGYSRNVESNPVRTKSATSFVGFVLGDILAQRLAGESFHFTRCLRLGMYGLLIDGPVGHWWYKLLDRKVMADNPQSLKAVLAKTAADQVVWAPVMTLVYFVFLRCVEGHPELIASTVQSKLIQTVAANYVLWPFAHFVNFRFIPNEHRILYNNVVSIFWNAFLSTLAHTGVDAPVLDTDQVRDALQQAADALPEPLHVQAARFSEALQGAVEPLHVQAAHFRDALGLPPGDALADSWTGSLRDLAARMREALPESVSKELPRLDAPNLDGLKLDVPRRIRMAAPTHPYLPE